ncbi:MAG: serine/threonine-protein kinase [Bryobacteraceae bacterium]|jgi:hypothetical protein
MNAPTRIGPYEIVRRLGKSMTDVYLAIDTVENRRVALKLIQSGGDTVIQLTIEAERRGAAIQKELHVLDPRVVEIYDFGDADGYFFVAMQYVEGRNLAEVLQSESTLNPDRAAAVALEICEQLAKFHSWQSAVVHGDIKPSNIHLGMNDTVRLLDFGIAKTLRADCDGTAHNFGSPSYCSPERLSRSRVDPQSDLWAVGATLYEMLAGVPPFQAESTRKLESLIRSRRPPRALPPGCPRALRAIVMKALVPDPERRYRSADDFQLDLQAFLEHKPTLAEMERRPAWSASATIDAARECFHWATRTARRVRQPLRVAGMALWFALGMTLWIGGTYAWQAWQAVRAAGPAPAAAEAPKGEMASLYIASADRVLESYRSGDDPALDHFDWQKAGVCLERAVELGAGDDRTRGKLALSRGYATLERLSGGAPYPETPAANLRLDARNQFALAAQKMAGDPAPHLALARLYVYFLPNVEKATAEFAAAGLLGATFGRREIEQQADALRIRAQWQAAAEPRLAWQDAQTARALYERIPGFDQVEGHLRELDSIRAPAPRIAPIRRSRRWR